MYLAHQSVRHYSKKASIGNVLVLGGGLMGSGIAQVHSGLLSRQQLLIRYDEE